MGKVRPCLGEQGREEQPACPGQQGGRGTRCLRDPQWCSHSLPCPGAGIRISHHVPAASFSCTLEKNSVAEKKGEQTQVLAHVLPLILGHTAV